MPRRSTASIPPSRAQAGGIHPCSIQVMAEHMSAVMINWPIHGCPSRSPAASTSPCAGGYIDM